MDRRQFIASTLAGAASIYSSSIGIADDTHRHDDENSIDWLEHRFLIGNQGIEIPVIIGGDCGFNDVVRLTGAVIDRPIFGLKPRSCFVTHCKWCGPGPFEANLFFPHPVGDGDIHVARVFEEVTGELSGVIPIRQLQKAARIRFIPQKLNA